MPSSSHNVGLPSALELKQAANWQCRACGRHCRRHHESLDDFARRIGHRVDAIAAHPRRWTLHLTKVHAAPPRVTQQQASQPSVVALCGSCHRTYHNCRRWQLRQQQYRQQLEQIGQLTLSDIRLPLTGLQLSFSEWSTPYEIVNPLPPRKRFRPRKD